MAVGVAPLRSGLLVLFRQSGHYALQVMRLRLLRARLSILECPCG